MIRMIPCVWGAVEDLQQLAQAEGWQWAGETYHADLGLAEAVWHGPSATRVAYLDDRFLELQYIAVEGETEVAVAARIAEAVALHCAEALEALHTAAPGPAEQAQSLLALSLLTGAEAAAERLARRDLAAGDPALRAAAVLAAAHVSPPDLRNLLAARRRVETDPRVRRRLDEVLGALAARAGQMDEARALLAGLPANLPEVLGALAARAGQKDEARALLAGLPANLPADWTSLAAEARLLVDVEGDLDAARAAVAAAPDDVDAVLKLGGLLFAQGQTEAAFDALLQGIAKVKGPRRDDLRKRLVELFDVVGVRMPVVEAARSRLAALWFS